MVELQVHLIDAQYADIDRGWNARNVRSAFWRLYINNRDGAAVAWPGGVHRLRAGRMHLVPAYVRFSCRNTRSIRHLFAHFDLLGLTPLLQQQLFAAPVSLPLTPEVDDLRRDYAHGTRPQSSPALLCRTQALILRSLGALIDQMPDAAQQRLGAAFTRPNPLEPAMRLCEQQLPLSVGVAEMAEACGYSPDHFTRLFHDLMGQTPARYVLQRRLNLAARQLLYGTDSIKQIAQRHGFANRFHFSRAFKRELGATPAAYRTTQRV